MIRRNRNSFRAVCGISCHSCRSAVSGCFWHLTLAFTSSGSPFFATLHFFYDLSERDKQRQRQIDYRKKKEMKDKEEGFIASTMKSLSQCWSLDLRSLALARILMSIVKVVDLYYRIEDFDFFYTEGGCAPRSVVLEHMSTGQDVSIFMASGARWWTDLCFFALLSATLLLGSARTRWRPSSSGF